MQIANSGLSGQLGTRNVASELERLFLNYAERTGYRRVIPMGTQFFPEEEKMPLYRYLRDYPMRYPDEVLIRHIEKPIDCVAAIKPENWMDLLTVSGYDKCEIGYCVFPDGSGYVASYSVRPAGISSHMEQWYRHWSNRYSRSAVEGHGNLRYKIANPADHFDNHYVNYQDDRLGISYQESMDLGKTGKRQEIIRHPFNLKEYGLTDGRVALLHNSGIDIGEKSYYETYDEPGSSFGVSIERPCPFGGTEIRTRKWIGWRPVNGVLVRDPSTRCTEESLKQMLIHMIVEREHLYSFLPELYEEYHDLPEDAD